ncbi:MAG: tetratricopeptide repeat protein [Spirulinaceae cyanobacterium]
MNFVERKSHNVNRRDIAHQVGLLTPQPQQREHWGQPGWVKRSVKFSVKLLTALLAASCLWTSTARFNPVLAHYDPIMLEALDVAIETSPDNAKAYQARGLIRINMEDYPGAIADYSQVIRLEPANTEAYIHRGTSRFWLRQYAGALEDFDRALELDDSVPVVYFNRGYVHRVVGNIALALADFERGAALAQAQGDQDTYAEARSLIEDLEPLPDLATPELLVRGQEKMIAGDFLGAVSDFAEVLRRRDVDTADRVTAYREQSQAWVALGNLEAALENLATALALMPSDATSYLARGQIYLEQGEQAAALAAFDQALNLDPTLADAYYQRGITYTEQGQYGAAIADFTTALAQNDTLAAAYGGRGLAYFQQGDHALALQDLERAAELFRIQGNFAGYQQTLALLATVEASAAGS